MASEIATVTFTATRFNFDVLEKYFPPMHSELLIDGMTIQEWMEAR